jgi:hypothetical protein
MDVDDEWYSIDVTIVRAHQHAAGAKGGRWGKALVAPEAVSLPRSA